MRPQPRGEASSSEIPTTPSQRANDTDDDDDDDDRGDGRWTWTNHQGRNGHDGDDD